MAEDTPAVQHIKQLRLEWADHKISDIKAAPRREQGDLRKLNYMIWDCLIYGKPNTIWHKGQFPLTMCFKEEFPNKPPECKFPGQFFHPNVYPDGLVSMDILDEDRSWNPNITITQILVGIQNLLDDPDEKDPTNQEAYYLFSENQDEYVTRVRTQTAAYKT
ncbi:hypothetical protein CQW23_32281 [Capsicum baccatum]|uniref:UBC core domain-containing protein n=1 Tax=Capsicum baccatum TaxID=33114 RepID=A0A2G2V549_CAPBA|nr:hypothetical protein CQW23_32281 [Capsicum baccatum]